MSALYSSLHVLASFTLTEDFFLHVFFIFRFSRWFSLMLVGKISLRDPEWHCVTSFDLTVPWEHGGCSVFHSVGHSTVSLAVAAAKKNQHHERTQVGCDPVFWSSYLYVQWLFLWMMIWFIESHNFRNMITFLLASFWILCHIFKCLLGSGIHFDYLAEVFVLNN